VHSTSLVFFCRQLDLWSWTQAFALTRVKVHSLSRQELAGTCEQDAAHPLVPHRPSVVLNFKVAGSAITTAATRTTATKRVTNLSQGTMLKRLFDLGGSNTITATTATTVEPHSSTTTTTTAVAATTVPLTSTSKNEIEVLQVVNDSTTSSTTTPELQGNPTLKRNESSSSLPKPGPEKKPSFKKEIDKDKILVQGDHDDRQPQEKQQQQQQLSSQQRLSQSKRSQSQQSHPKSPPSKDNDNVAVAVAVAVTSGGGGTVTNNTTTTDNHPRIDNDDDDDDKDDNRVTAGPQDPRDPSFRVDWSMEYLNLRHRRYLLRECLDSYNQLRYNCGMFVNNGHVQFFIIALIAVNAIMMGIGTFDFVNGNPPVNAMFETVDLIFLIIFTVELGFQFIYHGWRLILDGWLVFDLVIIITSWSFSTVQIIRAFRIFRALRLVTRIKIMKNLILGG
jgi:Ion transport protein